MSNIWVRLVLVALASFGAYKAFPQVQQPVDYYVKNQDFQKNVVAPSIKVANKVLPDKIQIPTPDILGASVDNSATTSSPLKDLTDQVSKQASDMAGQQIEQLKKSASDKFCQVLIEKVKSECGL